MSPNTQFRRRSVPPSWLLVRYVAVVTVGLAVAAPHGTARGDVVSDWNAIAVNATAAFNSAVQSRMLAIAHVAMYDAARAVDSRGKAYAVDIKASAGASIDAAVAAAAHGTLVRLLPAPRARLHAAPPCAPRQNSAGENKTPGGPL